MQDIDILFMASTSFSAAALLFYRVGLSFLWLLNCFFSSDDFIWIALHVKELGSSFPRNRPCDISCGSNQTKQITGIACLSYQDD